MPIGSFFSFSLHFNYTAGGQWTAIRFEERYFNSSVTHAEFAWQHVCPPDTEQAPCRSGDSSLRNAPKMEARCFPYYNQPSPEVLYVKPRIFN